jgi:hypothetical protein
MKINIYFNLRFSIEVYKNYTIVFCINKKLKTQYILEIIIQNKLYFD